MGFLKNSISITINRIATAGLALVISAVSARLLSLNEMGAIIAVTSSVGLLIRVVSLGLGQSAQYFGSREIVVRKSFAASLIAASVPLIITSFFILFVLGADLGMILFPGNQTAQDVFSLLKYGVPLALCHFLASVYFLGKRQMRMYFRLSVLPLLASVVVLLIGIAFKKSGFYLVILSWAAQYLVSFVMGGVFIFRQARLKTDISRPIIGELYVYGFRSFGVFLAAFAVSNISPLVGTWFTTSGEVGVFGVGQTFASALLLVYGAIGPLVFSYVGGMQDPKVHIPFIERTSRVSVLLFLISSFIIAVVAPFGIPLIFGYKYIDSYVVVWILLLGIFCSGIQRILENYLYGRNQQGLLIIGHAINIGILILGASVFAPVWGAQGVACASSLSYMGSLVFTIGLVYHTDGISPVKLLLPNYGDFQFLKERVRDLKLNYATRIDK